MSDFWCVPIAHDIPHRRIRDRAANMPERILENGKTKGGFVSPKIGASSIIWIEM